MRYEQVAAALACMALAIAGCKKDDASSPPTVTILAPTAGSTLQAPDTLSVSAQVNDDRSVQQVTFSVLNADGIPVVPASTVVPANTPATISIRIPLTSDQLIGGAMTLMVTASDGSSSGKDYRSFTLIPTPLRLRAAYVISTTGTDNVLIHRLDSAGQFGLVNTIASDLTGSAVSSWDQRVIVAGSASGPVLAFAGNATSNVWQWSNPGNGSPYFTSVDLGADGRLYVGTADGHVTAKDPGTGLNKSVIDLAPDERCERVITTDEKALCATYQNGSFERHFAAYFTASGALHTRFATDIHPRALFARDDDHALVFGDRNGSSVVQDLSISGAGGWEPRTWPAPISAVERLDANTYAVALTNGDLERFTYSNASSLPMAIGATYLDMAYDPVNDRLYAITASGLEVLDPQTGLSTASYAIPGTPAQVHLLFNR